MEPIVHILSQGGKYRHNAADLDRPALIALAGASFGFNDGPIAVQF
jgi:hypothetical protein